MKTSDYIFEDHKKKIYFNSSNKYHRLDGPAIIFNSGDEAWYKNGKAHRLDGPAKIFNNWDKRVEEFWIEGKKISSKEEFYIAIGKPELVAFV